MNRFRDGKYGGGGLVFHGEICCAVGYTVPGRSIGDLF